LRLLGEIEEIVDAVSDVIDENLFASLPTTAGAGKNFIFTYILEDNTGLPNIFFSLSTR